MNINELQNLTLQYRAGLLPKIWAEFEGTVKTGPFTGMRLVPEVCWGDGDTASKLMGLYEDEIQTQIKHCFVNQPDLVINVGSAEGYYAVGMARRLGCRTIAVDTDARARSITQRTADLNSVTVETLESLAATELEPLLQSAVKPMMIVDCEGYEQHLMDPVLAPSLKRTTCLIESHDCFVPGITETLRTRFAATHHVTVINARGKNPWMFRALDRYWDLEKLILVNECRPESAKWIWITPR